MEKPTDLLLSRWNHVQGQVQQRWKKITDEDLTRLSGRTEELAVILQEHYGYSKPQAVMEIFKWLQPLEQRGDGRDHSETAKEA
ncbi:MAG: CsbD family protein [Anaerolineales bacterium]